MKPTLNEHKEYVVFTILERNCNKAERQVCFDFLLLDFLDYDKAACQNASRI